MRWVIIIIIIIIIIIVYLFTNSTTEHDRDTSYEQDQQGSTSLNSLRLGLWGERTEKDSACFVNSKENKWVGSQQSWSKEGTVRHCQSEEVSILWSHHEETRELPGERNNARNNARCTQARKTTHGLDIKHQVVDRTLCGRVNQNDRG